jgi:hypothetical protein
LRRRMAGLGLRAMLPPFRAGLAHALLAGGAVWTLNGWLEVRAWWPEGFWGQLALLVVGGALGMFLVAAGLIGVRIRRGAMMAPAPIARGPGDPT